MTSNAEFCHQRLKQAIRRDVLFLVAGAIAYFIVAYVETHAADAEIRTSLIRSMSSEKYSQKFCRIDTTTVFFNHGECDRLDVNSNSQRNTGILDAGFTLTSHAHRYLSNHRDINDALAMINSMLFSIPLAYVVYVTAWKGDFTLSFRLISTHLFRSLCGWFTYLPPDPEFLMNCSSTADVPSASVPFVTFFSGHIATIVIISNHMYMRKLTTLSVILHTFNWFQALRLLATRGHYSIDLIIGYVVAVFVSDPAGKLGLYYSRRVPLALPSPMETFELLVGVRVTQAIPDSIIEKENKDPPQINDDPHNVQSETSVRVAVEIASQLASKRIFI
eukprot:CCRYP_013831-RF/>CCRYP_013831-RF protein AED:0.46 eAED:0.46 QI:0/0.33/0/1/0/0.25/4/0/332